MGRASLAYNLTDELYPHGADLEDLPEVSCSSTWRCRPDGGVVVVVMPSSWRRRHHPPSVLVLVVTAPCPCPGSTAPCPWGVGAWAFQNPLDSLLVDRLRSTQRVGYAFVTPVGKEHKPTITITPAGTLPQAFLVYGAWALGVGALGVTAARRERPNAPLPRCPTLLSQPPGTTTASRLRSSPPPLTLYAHAYRA